MTLLRLLVLAAALWSVPALSQGVFGAQNGAEPGQPRVIRRSRTVVDFSEPQVQGRVQGPSTVWVRSPGKRTFKSLIELRSSFRPELEGSTSAL